MGGPELLRGLAARGGVFPNEIEVELKAVSLAEEGRQAAGEALQVVELGFHEAVHGLHVAVVGGAMRGIEAVLTALPLLFHQLGERRQAVTAIPVTAELTAVVGLHNQVRQPDAAALEVGQQPVGEQQGVGGVVDGGESQPDGAFRDDAGGELVAGQAEGDQEAVGRQIAQVLDVDLEARWGILLGARERSWRPALPRC